MDVPSSRAHERTISGSRRLRVAAVVLAAVVASGAVGVLVGTRIESPSEAAARRRPPAASLVTVAVEQRPLSSSVVSRGTVRYAKPTPLRLAGPVGGDAVAQIVTAVLASGAKVDEGTRAAEVSGRPVFVLRGVVPMYRTIRVGATGRDVRQLQQALGRLGLLSGSPSAIFDDRTASAVAALYTRGGYVADRGDAADGRAGSHVVVPAGELVFLPELPLRVDTVSAPVGTAADGELLTLSESALYVETALTPLDAKLVRTGMTVRVEATEQHVSFTGKVTFVAPRPGTDGADASQVFARIVPSETADAKIAVGLPVRVVIPVQTSPSDSLVVPIAAVSAKSDGRSVVRVLPPAGDVVEVRVTPGLAADGYVAVTPAVAGTLRAGDRVVVTSP